MVNGSHLVHGWVWWGGGGCVLGVWVGECILHKMVVYYVNTHHKHKYSVLNSIWPKVH